MAQTLDLIPWPPDASPIYAAPAVLIPLEPKKTMLAGVKEHLYHPCLPTLRRMDMDTVANRLTDQHSRTSTTCCKGHVGAAPVAGRPVPRGEAGAAAAQHQPGGVAQLHARHAGLVPLRLRRRRVGAAQPPRQSSWLQLLCRQILKTRRHSNLEVLPQSESQPGSIWTKASSLQHSEHLQELWNCPQPLSLPGALALRSRLVTRHEAWDEPLPSF